jgi:hypothetical protein
MRILIQEHRNWLTLSNIHGFLPSKKAFVPFVGMFFYLFPRVSIRMDPNLFGSMDPDPDLDPH